MSLLEDTLKFIVDSNKRHVNPIGPNKYYGPMDFVLRHGQTFQYKRRPKKYPQMRKQYCFGNCLELCVQESLTYVEGYAMVAKHGLPVYHAWCSATPDSTVVIDPTAEFDMYIGVRIRRPAVIEKMFGMDALACFIDDMTHDFPLFQVKKETLMEKYLI